ncbi:MAG: phosphomannose isomerase type II C-terminal cupin domain [bacterium]
MESNNQTAKPNEIGLRPWGQYEVLTEDKNFKVKKISVNQKSCLSLQSHKKRAEHWVVVKGVARVVNGDNTLTLKANESTYIEANTKHQLANDADSELIIIEVQTGTYLGEDDIVRYEDIYGRKTGTAQEQ